MADTSPRRIFFELVRDSSREHTGAAAGGNYELSSIPIDTIGSSDATFNNYQRAYAAIATFLKGTSGTGDFRASLSTVRTLGGGDITILAPHGQIQAGLVSPPAGFNYSSPTDPSYALGFGIVTEKGGDIDLYAQGNISVNTSRVFTLEGGDMVLVSDTGNIDAGKGAKTVQASSRRASPMTCSVMSPTPRSDRRRAAASRCCAHCRPCRSATPT